MEQFEILNKFEEPGVPRDKVVPIQQPFRHGETLLPLPSPPHLARPRPRLTGPATDTGLDILMTEVFTVNIVSVGIAEAMHT
jgi:hypothetical protein